MTTETKKKWNYTYDYPDQRAKYGTMNYEGRQAMMRALGTTTTYVSMLIGGRRRMTDEHRRVADHIMQAQRLMEKQLTTDAMPRVANKSK